MSTYASNSLQQFKNLVAIRFQLYNSLFTSLPFHRIERTGVLLSLFLIHCEDGFKKNESPTEIIDSFLSQYTSYNLQEGLDLLFRFVQYTERQVVLFDALEDAAFTHINDMNGAGTLKQLQSIINNADKETALEEKLQAFNVRLVLTAHPTQFYPGEVLGIIHDLSKALMNENAALINSYLQQLGKTPFLRKQKPTPFDEATSLIWYLEHVFYQASGNIISSLKALFPHAVHENNPVIRMGFWPGGDRDGNPFVTADITRKVAAALREAIIRCYYLDIRRLKRRLTFKGVEAPIQELEKKIYKSLIAPEEAYLLNKDEMLQTLRQVKQTIITEHNGLFLHAVENFINKIETFGLYFASLDVRQDSSIHEKTISSIVAKTNLLPKNYDELSEEEKAAALLSISQKIDDISVLDDELQQDTLASMQAIKSIQQHNGEEACNRYIISHSTSVLSLLEVYGLFLLSGWKKEELTVDIIPLFETIDDLKAAAPVMENLYKNKQYKEHLGLRNDTQTIMLGFSDGTKDGGYLMANYSIYKAKEELTTISEKYGISVVFFDGRGGPPARGGGKTHRFYASMGRNISNKEIQLTVQGQTVSSNFGTVDTAQFNIEQLIHAGISNDIVSNRKATLTEDEEALLARLSNIGYDAYSELKNHPDFIDYLSNVSPLRYYAETNIASRPTKRGASKLTLDSLRAIPFVGAWSQTKQNVTGYYGVGAALQTMEKEGKWKEVQALYKNSLFFKTLIDNCEMAMKKCFFPLTAYLSKHPKYGEIWKMTYDEYELTLKYILRLSGNTDLMADYPVEQLSIQMRERIVLPLAVIQQYCLSKLRESSEKITKLPLHDVYEKLIIRCSFGIINAARNSV